MASQLLSSEKKLNTKVGTTYYVSPEILNGTYTEKCDIWSEGVILYNEIYIKISKMKFDFPENKWKNISKEAIDLIKHMLAPEKQRYVKQV